MQITPLIATLNHFSTINATGYCREIFGEGARRADEVPKS
jgi:hypothetical protein